MLTGESLPVEAAVGSEVAGATVNSYGRLVVRATKVGADTALAQIARWSTPRSPARRRCSGWPTGSPRSSCRS
jgi:Cu+-exporting ATPase